MGEEKHASAFVCLRIPIIQESYRANQTARWTIFAAYIPRIAALLLRVKDLDDHIGLSRPFALASLVILVSKPQKNITVLRSQTTSFPKAGKVGFTNIVSKSR